MLYNILMICARMAGSVMLAISLPTGCVAILSSRVIVAAAIGLSLVPDCSIMVTVYSKTVMMHHIPFSSILQIHCNA